MCSPDAPDAFVEGLPLWLHGFNAGYRRVRLRSGADAFYLAPYRMYGLLPIVAALMEKDVDGWWRLRRACDPPGAFLPFTFRVETQWSSYKEQSVFSVAPFHITRVGPNARRKLGAGRDGAGRDAKPVPPSC